MVAATQGMPVRPLPSAPIQAASAPPTLDAIFGQLTPPTGAMPAGVLPVGTVLPPPHD
jgi:hypothetical protein